jgi:hypothetical protein
LQFVEYLKIITEKLKNGGKYFENCYEENALKFIDKGMITWLIDIFKNFNPIFSF